MDWCPAAMRVAPIKLVKKNPPYCEELTLCDEAAPAIGGKSSRFATTNAVTRKVNHDGIKPTTVAASEVTHRHATNARMHSVPATFSSPG